MPGFAGRSLELMLLRRLAESPRRRDWWRWQEAGWSGTPMMEVTGPIVDAIDEDFMLRYLEGTNLGASPRSRSDPTAIELEAQHFLQEYAKDLRYRDRAAVAARYARSGATVVFNGERMVRAFDEIDARYRDQWVGPSSSEWSDLAYDVLDPGSVMVTGAFDRGTPDGVQRYAYSGVLELHEGELKFRLEVESRLPAEPGDQR